MKMDFFKNKFDLILSIGENCACTSYLRRCYLQSFSYPFDWLTHASFATRFDLIVNDFENFLNFDDLCLTGKHVAENADKAHDYYANKYTDFYHWHDFPADIPLENSYDAVYEKYQRRIKRLYRMIGDSRKILFVWLSHSKLHRTDEICSEYRKLQDKFSGKEIFLLVIENNSASSQEFLVILFVFLCYLSLRFVHYVGSPFSSDAVCSCQKGVNLTKGAAGGILAGVLKVTKVTNKRHLLSVFGRNPPLEEA